MAIQSHRIISIRSIITIQRSLSGHFLVSPHVIQGFDKYFMKAFFKYIEKVNYIRNEHLKIHYSFILECNLL